MSNSFSLLDGLAEELRVPAAESISEDFEDEDESIFGAIEETIEGELSASDVNAILDDENDDNEAADVELDDEELQAITDDALDEDLKILEALLAALGWANVEQWLAILALSGARVNLKFYPIGLAWHNVFQFWCKSTKKSVE